METLTFASLDEYVKEHQFAVNREGLNDSGWSLVDKKTQALLDKIRRVGVPLGDYVDGKIYRGVLTGLNEAFVIDAETREKLIAEDPKSAELIKPFLVGRDIKRYRPPESERYLILMPKGWTKLNSEGTKDAWAWLERKYPSIAAHLKTFTDKAQKRYDKGDYWWELRACDYYEEFEKPKILWPGISAEVTAFALDKAKYYGNDNVQLVISEGLYLLGILNSRLMRLVLTNTCDKVQGGFYRLKIAYVQQLPIRTIDFSDPKDKSRHDKMVTLVELMLALHERLTEATTESEKAALQQQKNETDQQIDNLVYELYGLTPEEIAIVEGK